MISRLSAVAFAFLLSPMAGNAQTQDSPTLNSPYHLAVGDYAALTLAEVAKANTNFDAPVVVTFEPSKDVIDVEIFGSRNTVEGARETIVSFWSFVERVHVPYVSRRFGVKLNQDSYRIMYYDRTNRRGSKLIVTLDRGQLVVPVP